MELGIDRIIMTPGANADVDVEKQKQKRTGMMRTRGPRGSAYVFNIGGARRKPLAWHGMALLIVGSEARGREMSDVQVTETKRERERVGEWESAGRSG